ncbi:MAG: calcium-binding protein, partial [Gammaproteobacteria bacterium]
GSDVITTGSGNDTVAGDNATITFSNGIRSSFITTDANGGNDTISLGAGDDQAIGGVGSDTIRALDGKNILLGDNGTILSDAAGNYIYARTGSVSLGSGDFITGGLGTDVIFGGVGGDTLSGGSGDDLIMGDAGEVTRNGLQFIFGSVDLFTGGADILTGGAGNDIMIGGFGSDLFFGSLSEDAMVGEYGRFTLSVDQDYNFVQTTSVVTLAQGPLDLINSAQSDIYEAKYFESVQERLSELTSYQSSTLTLQSILNLSPNWYDDLNIGEEGEESETDFEALIARWKEVGTSYSFFTSFYDVVLNDNDSQLLLANNGHADDIDLSDNVVHDQEQTEDSGNSVDNVGDNKNQQASDLMEDGNNQNTVSNYIDPEFVDEIISVDNSNKEITSEQSLMEDAQIGLNGWGLMGAVIASRRSSNKFVKTTVEFNNQDQRFIRWNDIW